ncbi:hypothetical protein [Streptomyces sp. NPDC093225]|uniref:hypothetical protein n=1 Tax=Streptomyces sp. NPDC093225 TaxID=3366034 RepID=UPI003816DB52
MSRAVGVAALAALTLLATSTAAQAHYVYEKELTYYEDPELSETPVCTEGRSEVSHGNGGGFSKSTVYSHTKDFDHLIRCGWDRYVPAGWIGSLETIWKWTGTEWAVCFDTGWRFNTATQWKTDFSRYWNVPCGPGFYGVTANGYVWDEEWDEWRGGSVWSGYHELAGDGFAASASRAPKAPPWVKNGVVDVSKVPALVASTTPDGSRTAHSVFAPPPNRPAARR